MARVQSKPGAKGKRRKPFMVDVLCLTDDVYYWLGNQMSVDEATLLMMNAEVDSDQAVMMIGCDVPLPLALQPRDDDEWRQVDLDHAMECFKDLMADLESKHGSNACSA